MILTTLFLAWASAACPSANQAIANAETAVLAKDYDALEAALVEAQRGLACGPVLESRSMRASFWLSQAMLLDHYGDRATSDKALIAAWRADPGIDVSVLPSTLQRRYNQVIERPSEDAAFRLDPPPDPNAVIYVDGRPYQQIAEGGQLESDASIATQSGLHIIQLAETPMDMEAAASRVLDLPPSATSEFDIYEEELFGRPLTALQIGGDYARPAGGCASKRK